VYITGTERMTFLSLLFNIVGN